MTEYQMDMMTWVCYLEMFHNLSYNLKRLETIFIILACNIIEIMDSKHMAYFPTSP